MAVTPSGMSDLRTMGPARDDGREPLLEPMVERALAAPVFAVVFAVASIFLKNPDFLALGAERPPRIPADSIGLTFQSATGVGAPD